MSTRSLWSRIVEEVGEDNLWVVGWCIVIALIILALLYGVTGCSQKETPVVPGPPLVSAGASLEEPPPPVRPHPDPRIGWKVVFVPAGTAIDGWTTPHSGLFIDMETVDNIVGTIARQKQELERYKKEISE